MSQGNYIWTPLLLSFPPPHFTNEKPEALAAQWLVPGRVAKKDTELAFEPCPLAFIP